MRGSVNLVNAPAAWAPNWTADTRATKQRWFLVMLWSSWRNTSQNSNWKRTRCSPLVLSGNLTCCSHVKSPINGKRPPFWGTLCGIQTLWAPKKADRATTSSGTRGAHGSGSSDHRIQQWNLGFWVEMVEMVAAAHIICFLLFPQAQHPGTVGKSSSTPPIPKTWMQRLHSEQQQLEVLEYKESPNLSFFRVRTWYTCRN